MKGKYAEDIHNFIPAGKRGESISVSIERDRIKYDKEQAKRQADFDTSTITEIQRVAGQCKACSTLFILIPEAF